ncbi:hypothetical protein TcasGA2_TC001080 [Tribolium castaneum]|uniref:Uncharacterized protein n=1 Tax=Tribolium castaneum TaxID=7070 RepID=D6WA03_TRICA|nr:hypothetical protein TcasGA2_TC001080 [Tribolium castaneum]
MGQEWRDRILRDHTIVCIRRCAVTKNGVMLAMERGSTTAFMCRCNTAAVMKYRTFMFWVLPKIVNSNRPNSFQKSRNQLSLAIKLESAIKAAV